MNPENTPSDVVADEVTQEHADAKTAELGVKIYSTAELNERAAKNKQNRVGAARLLFRELSQSENLCIIQNSTEKEIEDGYLIAINALNAYVEENGLTTRDLHAIKLNLMQIGLLIERVENAVGRVVERLTFNLTGENNFDDVSIRKLNDLAQASKN